MDKEPERILETYRRADACLKAHFDLTWRCPLRCRHCYLGGRTDPEMTTNQALGVIESLVTLGAYSITFSGGEIFLREDLEDLVAAARGHRMYVHLKTSAWPATETRLQALASLGVARVDVSLYGTSPEEHDSVTRVPGSFRKAVDVLFLLQGLPIPDIRTVVTPMRAGRADAASLVSDLKEMGLQKVSLNELADLACDGYPLDGLEPSREQRKAHWREVFGAGLKPSTVINPDNPLCMAGVLSLYVAPDGTVRPCLDYPEAGGNCLETPLEEIWRSSEVFKRLKGLSERDRTECKSCNLLPLCSFCPALAIKERADPTLAPPSLCRKTRLWAEIAGEVEDD